MSLTASVSPRSSLMMDGGEARVKPVPTTSHPSLWNATTTFRPSRPEAPVMRTFLDMMVGVDEGELLEDGSVKNSPSLD